jgi:hypothetical protein
MQRIQLGSGGREEAPFLAADLPLTDLNALFRQAEKISGDDREQVELFLQRLQTQLRHELLMGIEAGTVRKGLVKANTAVQQARAYTAANLNLRLLLEDLFLTLYEELGRETSL